MDKLLEQRFVLSALVITVAAIYDFCTTFMHPLLDKEMLMVIITSLNGSGLLVILNWWFGSSKGSADKDAALTTVINDSVAKNNG